MADNDSNFSSWASELVEPGRVRREAYTDRDIFEHEMRTLFGGNWTYVAHTTELAGKAFVVKRLGRRSVIVSMNESSEPSVVLNRCGHRGAELAAASDGADKRLRCPYHGWTYSLDGELTGVTYHTAYEPGVRDRGRLFQFEASVYCGFIFARTPSDSPDLRTYLGSAADVMDEWSSRTTFGRAELGHGCTTITYRGNWKLALDNAADGYHIEFTHAALNQLFTDRYGARATLTGGQADKQAYPRVESLGNGHVLLRMTPPGAGRKALNPTPGREGVTVNYLRMGVAEPEIRDRLSSISVAGINLAIFPNLLLLGNQIQVVEPLSVSRTALKWYATLPDGVPDIELASLGLRQQEDFPLLGEPDDIANFEACQRGLEDGVDSEWVYMDRFLDESSSIGPMTSELPVRAFWREWVRSISGGIKA